MAESERSGDKSSEFQEARPEEMKKVFVLAKRPERAVRQPPPETLPEQERLFSAMVELGVVPPTSVALEALQQKILAALREQGVDGELCQDMLLSREQTKEESWGFQRRYPFVARRTRPGVRLVHLGRFRVRDHLGLTWHIGLGPGEVATVEIVAHDQRLLFAIQPHLKRWKQEFAAFISDIHVESRIKVDWESYAKWQARRSSLP